MDVIINVPENLTEDERDFLGTIDRYMFTQGVIVLYRGEEAAAVWDCIRNEDDIQLLTACFAVLDGEEE